MHIAAAHHPPTTRRHYPAGQRMKGVVDRLFARQNPGAMSLSRPAPARRISASALGVEAVKAGRSVYFSSLADIVASLAKAEREGALREKSDTSAASPCSSSTKSATCPVIPGGGNLFFQLVNARYEKGAMILTSNRGFAEWGDIFGDSVVATALLDRLLHHAVVCKSRARAIACVSTPTSCPNTSGPKPTSNLAYSVHPKTSRKAAQQWRRRSTQRLIPARQTGEFCRHFSRNSARH